MPEAILQTKLYMPPLRGDLVRRARLVEQLDRSLGAGKKLSLVSAPAGFGKTTLVAEWAVTLRPEDTATDKTAPRFAWLSLDEYDNDPIRFLTYVVAAFQTLDLSGVEGIETGIGQGAAAMLHSPQPPSSEVVLTSLINDISATPGRTILVLDDYHLIDSSAIDDSLTFLIEHFPPQMHLVIATRDDPYLPLARLRAHGQLTELRAADLRFSAAEAADFLNRVMGLDLSVDDMALLEGRTEGWIVGLQLAAISMQGHDDANRLIKSFTGSHRFVLDYLIAEVLERQTADVQSFLLKSAILERLTGSLCDALTGRDDGQATLEMLEQANLFVVPLDNERRWYRYHHLFADLLRQRLRQTHPEQVPALHGRASDWYEENNLPYESIRHAFAAGDLQRAASLAELAWPEMSLGSHAITWHGWLEALPDDLVRQRPVLCAGYAWAFLNSGQLEAAETWLEAAERWLEPAADNDRQETGMVVVDEAQFRALPLTMAAARAYHAQAVGDVAATMLHSRRVLDLAPEGEQVWRRTAAMLLNIALYASGDVEEALQGLSAELGGLDPLEAITGTFLLAEMQTALGRLHAAMATCKRSLQFAKERGQPTVLGSEDAYSGLSLIHREQGDLEVAAQNLAISRELGEQIELPDWQHRWYIAQARLKQSLGELDEALDLLEKAELTFVRTPVPELQPIAAMKARVWVVQGRLAEALGWARERDLSAQDDLSYMREFEHMTLVRLLIAQYRSDRLERAIHQANELLARLLIAADKWKRYGSVIEILVLQALTHESQGNTNLALVALERALTLAEPEGYCRIFVDEGPAMARLLYEALARDIAPDYVRALLAAFADAEPQPPGPSLIRASESEWVEPLTERETEVLQLIAEGLTNQEIASRLYLSLNTVKVHARNIYAKLSVRNRAGAIARARTLGILPGA